MTVKITRTDTLIVRGSGPTLAELSEFCTQVADHLSVAGFDRPSDVRIKVEKPGNNYEVQTTTIDVVTDLSENEDRA